ncbi:hypothetical protein [Priestia flexa]|uniref:hypothetical protein n=1 Tax=Priestia flexa TaxID=86664 RepID=UPI001F4C94E5|nr:hypothetical protein [Priestia flexa]
MRYRPPRNKWGADFAEDYEKNLEDIERDITGVEEIVEGSKTNAEQALTFATEAKGKAESIQEQFNQVVIEGDSSVEAAQARVDANNVAHPTLKARADSDYNKVTAQLAEITRHVNNIEISLELYKHLAINVGSVNEDWSPAINSALNEIGQNVLYIPFDIQISSGIRLSTKQGIKMKKGSRIKAIIGFNDSFIIGLKDDKQRMITLEDVSVFGDVANQPNQVFDGINLTSSFENSDDSQHYLNHVFINAVPKNGLVIKGRGASNITNIHVLWTRANGCVFETWDNVYSNISSGSVALSAFKLDGASNRYIACKGWWALRGFETTSNTFRRNNFISCEAQDVGEYGFYIFGYENNLFDAKVDSVGAQGDNKQFTNSPAFKFDSASSLNTLYGSCMDRAEYFNGVGTMDYVLDLAGTHNKVIVSCSGVKVDIMKSLNYNRSNHVDILGTKKDGTPVREISSHYSTNITVKNSTSFTKRSVMKVDFIKQIYLVTTNTTAYVSGVNIATIDDDNFKPEGDVNLAVACKNTSDALLGFAVANITTFGNIYVYNIPANTVKIEVSGVFI